MKRLPPSIQEKNRYLRFKVHGEQQITFSKLVEELWEVLIGELGTLNLSEADLWIIKNKYDIETGEGVIRTNRDMEDEIRAALTLLTQVEDQEAFIEVKKASGMIDKV